MDPNVSETSKFYCILIIWPETGKHPAEKLLQMRKTTNSYTKCQPKAFVYRYSNLMRQLYCKADFTSKLVRELAFGTSKFYIAPYDKINHGLVNMSSNCDVKSGLKHLLSEYKISRFNNNSMWTQNKFCDLYRPWLKTITIIRNNNVMFISESFFSLFLQMCIIASYM